MKYIKIVLLASIILASFGCSKNLSPSSSTIVKDSIVYIPRDTTLDAIVSRGKHSVSISDKLNGLPTGFSASNKKTEGHTTASYDIKDGKINIECNEEAYLDTIKNLKLKLLDKESYHVKTETIKVPVEVIKYKIPTWIKLLFVGLGLGVLGVSYVKGWLSIPFKFLGSIFNFLSKK